MILFITLIPFFTLRAISRELGDYAVTIRAKMMTVPGKQFVIRCKAYAMIKNAFDENDIKFTFPTVQVAGEA